MDNVASVFPDVPVIDDTVYFFEQIDVPLLSVKSSKAAPDEGYHASASQTFTVIVGIDVGGVTIFPVPVQGLLVSAIALNKKESGETRGYEAFDPYVTLLTVTDAILIP